MKRTVLRLLSVIVIASIIASSGLVSGGSAEITPIPMEGSTSPTCADMSFSGGDGSAETPYEIENVSQLQCIEEDLGAHYELVSDVDASATSKWNDGKGFEPIGSTAEPFTGSFDGNQSTISGLSINRPQADEIGLFGHVGVDGKVRNATLESAEVTGRDEVGGLVGANHGDIAQVNVDETDVNGTDIVGGLVGENHNGTIARSESTSAVIGTTAVGGLVGTHAGSEAHIQDSYATGNVAGNEAGGLVGVSTDGIITQTYATGNVTGDAAIGGLVGNVSGYPAVVNQSYAAGNVTGDSDTGGRIGKTGRGPTIETSYWDTETTGQEATNQYGVSTGELTGYSALTHVDELDFDEVWSIGSANGQVSYPTLRANPQTPAPGTRRLYDGGNGTVDDAYTIANWSHLNNTRENLNANFTVTSDLTKKTDGYRAVASPSANDDRGFDPISGRFPGFTGSLDGQGHAIENLTINRTDEDGVGLFKSVPTGRFGTGTVRNLDLVNVDIAGGDRTGAVAGAHSGAQTIENISVEGHIDGGRRVGGVVGVNAGHVRNVSIDGTVNGSIRVGGLVGDNSGNGPTADGGTILNSHAGASVEAYGLVGGLVGANGDKEQTFGQTSILSGGTISNSSASGTVTVTASPSVTGERAGGLVGQMYLGNITRSSASGTVDAPDATHVGGLVGYADATEPEPQGGGQRPIPVGRTIRESYATGDVSGNESVGGLVGTTRNETVVHSYAVGNVTGDTAVGGLVGTHTGANANVTEVYAAGTVSEGTDAGGLIGTPQESPAVESAYWDTETTAQSSPVAGTGLTTSQLKANESLDGFDFQHTWDVVANETHSSYPYLLNNTQSPAPGLATRVSVDTVEARDATVEAGRQGQLVVRATASGAPAADTQIVVESDDGLSGISSGDTAMTNATGEATFSFSGSTTGTYTLTVALAGDETVSDTATITVEPEPTPSPDPAAFDVEIDTPAEPVAVGTTVEIGAAVTNTGDQSSTQSIRLKVDGSTVDQTTVTLAGGERTSVPLTWTPGADDRGEVSVAVASDDDTAATSITVDDPVPAASFEVSLDKLPATVNAGQPLTVAYTVTNRGESAGAQPLQFRVNGTQEATEPVELAANASQRGTFTYRPDRGQVGPLSITVASANDSATGSVTVESPDPADIGIANITTSSPVTENGTLLVDATLENTGAGPGETPVGLTVADYRDETTVRLGPGETTNVTFEWPTAPDEAGNYTAIVTAGNQTREVLVRVEASTTDFTVTTLTQSGPVAERTDLSLTATIENAGTVTATQDVVGRIPGANVTRSTAVTLGPGESTTVAFTWTPPSGAAGTYTAEARTAADTATTSIAVEPAVQALRVDTAADTILTGETTTATATAVLTDGDTTTVTDEATFNTTDPAIATVDADGTVTGVEPGTTTITATYANRTATTELTITDATPTLDTATVSTERPDLLEATFSPGVSLRGDDPTAGVRVTADGTPVPVTTAVATDDTLLVGLGRPVGAGSNLTVSYDASTETLVGPTGVAAPSFSDVTITNRVEDRLVRAEASASSYRVTAGTDVTLRATGSTIASGVTPTYTWTVDGTQIAETTTPVTTHTFTEAGARTVEVRVSAQGASASDTDSVTIDVDDRPPTAALTLSKQAVAPGETVTADANGSRDAVGIDSYAWSFGDNTTAQGPALTTPTHSYAAPGEYQVSVTVTDTNGQTDTATQSVLVNGPRADVQTEPLAYGTVAVGSTTTQTVPIENTGTETLTVTDAAIEGTDAAAYSLVEPLDTGSLTVRPGERQPAGVTFAPSTAKELSDAELVIETDDPMLTTTRIDVSGKGVDSNLTPVDSTGTFGSVAVGDTTSMTVAFKNTGDAAATLSNVSATDPQVTVTDAPDTIPAGATETVTVAFTPTQAGDVRATLTMSTDDGSSASASLTGSGIAPALHVSDDALTFGEIGVDGSATETLAISNYGTDTLMIAEIDITGSAADGFTAGEPPATVAPGETATVDVTATPATAGQQDAVLTIESTDPTTPRRTVELSAEGVAAEIDIGARTLDFGETAVGETVTLNLSVANRLGSPGDLQIDRTAIVGQHPEDFSIVSGRAPQTLAPGESQTLEVAFTASEVGERTAQIQLESNAANEPFATIWLTNVRSYILVREVSNPTVNIEGANLERGSVHRVNTTTPAAADEPVTVVRMDLAQATAGDFEVNKVYEYSSPESTTPDRGPGEAVIRYVSFENRSVPPGMFADRTATIDVDRAALPDGVTPEEITLQQFVPARDAWEPVELQLVDESAARYRFEADLHRFETLAVTAPETQLESLTLELAATTLDVNATAGVDVTAAFSDGTTDTVTPNATITSQDPEIARVERAAETGVSVIGVETGDTTLVANVTVGNRVVTATQPITVRAGDDTDDEPSSGGGGSDGGGLSASRADVTATQPTESGEEAAYTVSLRNVYAGQQVVADFTTEQATTGFVTPSADTWPPTAPTETPASEASAVRNVQSDGLVLTVADRGDYDLTVTARDVDVFARNARSAATDAPTTTDDVASDEPAGEVASSDADLSTDALGEASRQFVEATARRPVGFITVDHNFESEDLETATHRFRVRKSYLTATGATAESVTLYRSEADGYRALPTQEVAADETSHYFEAETPGFSTFVIGTDAPVFDLGDPTLVTANETDGRVEATVPVENVGTHAGTYTARLRGDGSVLATTTVSLPPGETVTARVQTTLSDADEVTLSLAGRSLGTVSSGDQETVTEADEEPSDSSSSLVAVGIVLLVFAVLAVVIFGAWRRTEPTDESTDDADDESPNDVAVDPATETPPAAADEPAPDGPERATSEAVSDTPDGHSGRPDTERATDDQHSSEPDAGESDTTEPPGATDATRSTATDDPSAESGDTASKERPLSETDEPSEEH